MNEYCCGMRKKFIVAVVATNPQVPEPVEVVDFIIDFEKNQLAIKFCPWCGSKLNIGGGDPFVTTTPQ